MAKYRRKPMDVEATQFFERNLQRPSGVFWDGYWAVTTIHGQDTPIADGDFIVTEPDGEHYYPCKPDIFLARHDFVEE